MIVKCLKNNSLAREHEMPIITLKCLFERKGLKTPLSEASLIVVVGFLDK